jgi:hypothetical protein
MRPYTIMLYQFDELTDAAKEAARQWWRTSSERDGFWSETVIDDAKEIGKLLGIDIDNIYFSGFSRQGDGAQFTGTYYYNKGAAKAVAKHAPGDVELLNIATNLQDIQRRNFYQLSASVAHSGHYSHEFCTTINTYKDGCDVDADTEDGITEFLRDFMRWIYARLEAEYIYCNADEQVDDNIRCNEYEFTEEGDIS